MGFLDHYPICAMIQEYEDSNYFSTKRRKKKWTVWKPKTDEQQHGIPERCDEE